MEARSPGIETDAVPFFAGGPEALLHVGEVGGHAGDAAGAMLTGPWNVGTDGVPAHGPLGVLIDVVWGGAALACAPPGEWARSTELEASFGAPVPTDGSRLSARGEVVHRDGRGALATGTVRGPDASIIAAGTVRARFGPGMPQRRRLDPATVAGLPGRPISELIGLAPGADGVLSFAASPSVANPAGIVHGGLLFCVCELAASHALAAADRGLAATSLHIVYVRPGIIGEEVRCETEVLYRGRTAAAVQARCLREDGKACAVALLSYGPASVLDR